MQTRIPNSRALAERRLNLLQRRISGDPQLRQQYAETMQMFIERVYAESVLECKRDTGRLWFLQHHLVLNLNKPDK